MVEEYIPGIYLCAFGPLTFTFVLRVVGSSHLHYRPLSAFDRVGCPAHVT